MLVTPLGDLEIMVWWKLTGLALWARASIKTELGVMLAAAPTLIFPKCGMICPASMIPRLFGSRPQLAENVREVTGIQERPTIKVAVPVNMRVRDQAIVQLMAVRPGMVTVTAPRMVVPALVGIIIILVTLGVGDKCQTMTVIGLTVASESGTPEVDGLNGA